ncbi:MAG: hypothetical protein U0S49_02600 [Rhodospirillales bacterium]|nr:hypothetical protein [Rhodospirillales bacterium]
MRWLRLVISALTALGLAPAPASAATLLGKQFSIGYYLPDTGTLYGAVSPNPVTATVGAGTEASFNVEGLLRIDVDMGASTIDVFYSKIGEYTNNGWSPNPFSGLIFNILGGDVIDFTGISATPQAAMPGFGSSRAGLSSSQITLNWEGLPYDNGGGASTVRAVHAQLTPVPIPAALPLMAVALLGLGFIARRRQA